MIELGPFIYVETSNEWILGGTSDAYPWLCGEILYQWFDVDGKDGPLWLQFHNRPGKDRLKVTELTEVYQYYIIVEGRNGCLERIMMDTGLIRACLELVSLPIYVSVVQEDVG